MKRMAALGAMSLMTAALLFSTSLFAQGNTSVNPTQPTPNTAIAPDHDGDGIPNGQDPDFIKGSGKGRRANLNFVDENGDGISDYFQGSRRGRGRGFGWMNLTNMRRRNFIDADSNGTSDNRMPVRRMGNGSGKLPYFIDSNGDGICDRFQGAPRRGQGFGRSGRGRSRR